MKSSVIDTKHHTCLKVGSLPPFHFYICEHPKYYEIETLVIVELFDCLHFCEHKKTYIVHIIYHLTTRKWHRQCCHYLTTRATIIKSICLRLCFKFDIAMQYLMNMIRNALVCFDILISTVLYDFITFIVSCCIICIVGMFKGKCIVWRQLTCN